MGWDLGWDTVAALAQVFGFAGIVWGLVENWRTLQTQVAMEFYRRFAELTARMPSELRLASYYDNSFAALSPETKAAVVLSMLDYLNLSSEEYALYTKGRLPPDTWQVTAAEMRRNFTRTLWRDVWFVVRNEYASHKAFLTYMDKSMSSLKTGARFA